MLELEEVVKECLEKKIKDSKDWMELTLERLYELTEDIKPKCEDSCNCEDINFYIHISRDLQNMHFSTNSVQYINEPYTNSRTIVLAYPVCRFSNDVDYILEELIQQLWEEEL